MPTTRSGLRERKKEATHRLLREAALRLALERGVDNVRVDDIAEAAGVSPRTYNNYFSSREQAIVAAITAERETRVAAALAATPASVRLSEAVIDAIVEQYTSPDDNDRVGLLLRTSRYPLHDAYLRATTDIEHPIADAMVRRIGDDKRQTAEVLSAAIAGAVRVGLERWLQPAGHRHDHGLVVASGNLPDVLRAALAPLAPAIDAAEQ